LLKGKVVKPSIKDEILAAVKTLDVSAVELDENASAKIREELLRRFGRDMRFELNVNNLADYAAVQHPDAWQWLDEYLGPDPVFLFYDSHDEQTVLRVAHGSDVVRILGECFGFIYYVTNESLDYLLCENDHDYLIGAGAAKPWVQSLAPRHDAWVASLKA
jgi:hypothetical protein